MRRRLVGENVTRSASPASRSRGDVSLRWWEWPASTVPARHARRRGNEVQDHPQETDHHRWGHNLEPGHGRIAPQEAPGTLELIIKSVFMGAVMQEERMIVDATSDEPVELTLVLDEQARENL